MISRLSLFIHLFLFTQTLFAAGVLRYEDTDVNKVVVKKSADLLSKGGAVVTEILSFKSASPAMLTGSVSTIASSARLLRMLVQVQQGCS